MNKIYRILGITILFGVTAAAVLNLQRGKPCQLKDSSSGICTIQTECNYAREQARKGLYNELVICSFSGNTPVICCPSAQKVAASSSKSKSEQYCDLIKAQKPFGVLPTLDHQIRNGVPASVREFPHMVAIGYTEALSTEVKYRCAGALISRKWVLTASHCIKRDITQVRVGAVSLTKTVNVQERPQEIKIKNFIKYPDFRSTSKYDDIALMELEKEVDVTNGFARPMCLPTMNTKAAKDKYTIAGWGFLNKTTLSDALFKADIYEIPQRKCVESFQHFAASSYELEKGIVESQLCAENRITRSDTCQGDSGGPMFFKNSGPFYIYGVTSFGLTTQCSETGEAPGIYTRVYPYLKWIEDTVWPGNNVNDF